MTGISPDLCVGRLWPGDLRWPAFVEVLATEHLPTDDLGDPSRVFFRVERGGEPVGFGGYELHGEDALLRSLVILPGLRGLGLGRQVTESVVRAAAGAGARRAWLLTATAAPFFARLGFARVERRAAPASIRSTRQAAQLCPSSAALMMRDLTPEA